MKVSAQLTTAVLIGHGLCFTLKLLELARKRFQIQDNADSRALEMELCSTLDARRARQVAQLRSYHAITAHSSEAPCGAHNRANHEKVYLISIQIRAVTRSMTNRGAHIGFGGGARSRTRALAAHTFTC